jgi:hypothetical protein
MRDEVLSLNDTVDAADAGCRFLQDVSREMFLSDEVLHFGEQFWLYAVTSAKSEAPALHRIPNPAAGFRVGEEIVATGYIIQEDTWRERIKD